MKLFRELKDFKPGDMVGRTRILEKLEKLTRSFTQRNDKLSLLMVEAWEYCDGCSYTVPVSDLFHALGLYLETLFNAKKEAEPVRKKKLSLYYRKLRSLINEKGNHASHDRPSDDNFQFTFSLKDEKALDYSGIVYDEAVVETYVAEVEEFLDSAQVALLDLEHDSINEEAINRVFRCFHTIKSSSAFLGMKNIEVLAHQMENMLGKVRSGELKIQPELTDIIFHGIGLIRDLNLLVRKHFRNSDELIQGFKSFVLTPYIQLVERITEEFKFRRIGEILRDMGHLDQGTLDALLAKQKKNNQALGSLAIAENLIDEKDLQTALEKQVAHKTKQSFVRVNSERISQLIDMVGELVVNQSMIRQKFSSGGEVLGERDIQPLEEVTTSIKDLVLSMGMIPLQEMFQKLRIVVRNVSRDLDKSVSFNVSGEETEMDRSLVESIYDPLVHMVRNAVSHGIEDNLRRSQSGKNVVGRIDVDARYKGNGIEISVSDDGGGIDPEVIVDKAIKLGMLEPAERGLTLKNREQVFGYLFKAGFSTREKADNISGRGVGMDVVMQNLTRINGKLEIESELGKGTQFRIKLPLTLAIIDGFVTEIMGEYYVFPFEAIDEILVWRDTEVTEIEGDVPMAISRGEHFPLIDLRLLLGEERGEYDDSSVLIKIRYDDKVLAVPVNGVLGKQEIVIKNLNELIRHQTLFYGGTIFGSGAIGFVLDIDEIISRAGNILDSKENGPHPTGG